MHVRTSIIWTMRRGRNKCGYPHFANRVDWKTSILQIPTHSGSVNKFSSGNLLCTGSLIKCLGRGPRISLIWGSSGNTYVRLTMGKQLMYSYFIWRATNVVVRCKTIWNKSNNGSQPVELIWQCSECATYTRCCRRYIDFWTAPSRGS